MIKRLVELIKKKKLGVAVKVSSDVSTFGRKGVIGSEDKGRIKKSKDTGLFIT